MKKKTIKNGVPIKYMLSIPVIKLDLRDKNGEEIEVANLTQFNGGIVVIDKKGRVYTDK